MSNIFSESATELTPTPTPRTISCPAAFSLPPVVRGAMEGVEMWHGKNLMVKPMDGGLNNENWYVRDDMSREYFIKVPGAGTGFIDRSVGHAGALKASELGIGAKVYEFNPETGVEVTEFLRGYDTCTTTTLRTQEQGLQVMETYRALHASEKFGKTNMMFDQIDQHIGQMKELGLPLPAWADDLLGEYDEVKQRFNASGIDLSPCHNDPMPGNFMVNPDGMKLIDFEFCGDNEPTYELGLFFCEMFYDDEEMLPLIESYYGSIDPHALARIRVSRVMGDLKWGMWGIINSVVRDVGFDYWKYGIWKLMRAKTYQHSIDWDASKLAI